MSDNKTVIFSVGELLNQTDGEKILCECMTQQARRGELGSTWKPAPPDGLSAGEQARWWLREPEMLLVAQFNGDISEQVMQAIERAAKDNDLAHKIIDAKKVDGLTNAERSRLFEILTDGGAWEPKRKGPPSTALSDLRIAFELKNVLDSEERKQKLSAAIHQDFGGGKVEADRIRKRIKRIEALWEAVRQFDHDVIASLLEDISDYDNMDADMIPRILSILSKLSQTKAILSETNPPSI